MSVQAIEKEIQMFKYHQITPFLMVLESLFNPFVVKKKPWEMIFAGFLYSVVALVVAYFVFKEIAGLLAVFLVVISALPLVFSTIKNEEELDLKYDKEWKLLKEHTKVILYLIFMFIGITAAFTLAYILLPTSIADTVFGLQKSAITTVNNVVHGGSVTGQSISQIDLLGRIFLNNLKVLFFCLIFSLLYGTGAIFILTWNASVIATAIGGLVKTELATIASAIGFSSIAAYFSVATTGFFRYMTHGILEIGAYFVAGLAGGIISVALIRHNLQEDKLLVDTIDLILISMGLLMVAGVVEVYVTPLLFKV